MALQSLLVQNLRNIQSLELSLADDVNLFFGANGAGKTSILEAIDFLSRGRSFRHHRLNPLLRKDAETITVSSTVQHGEQKLRMGIEKSSQHTTLHQNQQKVASISAHAMYLPVVSMHPDSHQLIQGGAKYRRNFIDWTAFHVKHDFLQDWRDFNKCLRQRNQMLRSGKTASKELLAWTEELCLQANKVNEARSAIFNELKPIFLDFIDKILPEAEIELDYYAGWPKELTLASAIEQTQQQEQVKRTTQRGPHRADIKIQLNQQTAAAAASRGQQKLIAACLLLAQIKFAQANSKQRCIVLLDDIRAELDQPHTNALLAELQALKCQAFITAIEEKQINLAGWKEAKTFHVKQGTCEAGCD